jgi:hypothetical protein
MDDEVLARLAALVGVVLAGEYERLHHPRAVDGLRDLVGMLLDDREQIREQVLLELREIGGDRPVRPGVRRGVIDLRMRGDGDAALAGPARDRRQTVGAYAAARIGALLRYRSPSSRRRW